MFDNFSLDLGESMTFSNYLFPSRSSSRGTFFVEQMLTLSRLSNENKSPNNSGGNALGGNGNRGSGNGNGNGGNGNGGNGGNSGGWNQTNNRGMVLNRILPFVEWSQDPLPKVSLLSNI